MHHPRSSAIISCFRLAALLMVGNFLIGLSTAGLLVHSVITSNREMTILGLGLVMLVLIVGVAQWIVAASALCPLCATPALAPKGCAKHRQARTLCGSHRLRVAAAIVCKNQFRCPYCNESTELEVREALNRPRP